MSLYLKRIEEYYEAERNKTGRGPAYWSGKKFYENLIGRTVMPDIYTEATIAICGGFLTGSLVGIRNVLEEFKVKY